MMKSIILEVGICIGNQMDESAIIHMINHHAAIADLQQIIFGDRSPKNAEQAIFLFNEILP